MKQTVLKGLLKLLSEIGKLRLSLKFDQANLKSESTEKLGRMGGAGFHIIVSKNGIFFPKSPTFIEFAPFIESADSWKDPLAPSPLQFDVQHAN